MPYPYAPNPGNEIQFPTIKRIYSWNTDLSLTVGLTDMIFGNRMDFTIDTQLFDPSDPVYSVTSKAFMNHQGILNYPIVQLTGWPTASGPYLYDISYKNKYERYDIL